MGEAFDKRLRRLERGLPSFYRQKRFSDVHEALQRLLIDANGVDQRVGVRAVLTRHYHFVQDDDAALRAISDQIAEKPNDLLSLIDLAEHFHYHQVDLQKAADAVERALAAAVKQGLLVRQVLGVRLRIALETANFDIVGDSLSRLVEYQPIGQSLDVAYESDFIERIPSGSIDVELIERYRALLQS